MVYLRLNQLTEIFLGGEDFDNSIVEYLASNLKDNGIDLKTDKLALQRLKEAAKKLKLNFHLPRKQKSIYPL